MSISTRLALVAIALWVPVTALAELAAVRPEFQVSTGPAYSAYYGYVYPHTEAKSSNHVAASPSGTFIVAWEDYYFQAANGTLRPGIFARRLDSLGRPLAGEFRASPLTSYIRGASHVASDDAGNFVVVWDETDQYYIFPGDDDGTRIMARRFNASGGALGSAFLVNSYTTGYQSTPKVAFDGAGNFVVVWAYYKEYPDAAILAGQKFNASGSPVGGEFQVNTDTSCCIGYSGFEGFATYDQVDIAGDASGHFMVVWRGPPASGSDEDSITARLYDSTGSVGGAFIVNTITTSGVSWPAVASDHRGHFLVTWKQGSPSGIFARRYDATGAPLAGDFQVNTPDPHFGTVFEYPGPSIAADATGRFVVVWIDYDDGLFGREFDPAGAPVGGEFRVDQVAKQGYNEYPIAHPDIAASAAGDFVVTWSQYGSYDDFLWSSVARRLGPKPVPCTPAPKTGCRATTRPGSGVLVVKTPANAARSQLTWRFARGAAMDPQALGDPFTTDSYAVCLYDGSPNPQPRFEADVPASGACGAVPCWKLLSGNRVDYLDKVRFVRGISLVRLSPGSEGRTRVLVKGGGADLELPSLPLTTPVVFQLQAANGECWTGTYATGVKRNDGAVFKATPDS